MARLNWRKQGPLPRPAPRRRWPTPRSCSASCRADLRIPFDPREIIARVVDGSGFHEFKPVYGPSLITGWASLYGYPVGILANARGVLFSAESQKAAQFIQLANQTDTPLLFLQNTTGYMVGNQYEQGGIIKHGAMMINAVSNRAVPHITLLIGRLLRRRATTACAAGPTTRGSCSSGRAARRRSWGRRSWRACCPSCRAGRGRGGRPAVRRGRRCGHAGHGGSQIEAESLPMFQSGRIYDDGIIDPRDTRTVLGLCLSVIHGAPVRGTAGYGVFRM